MNTLPTVYQFHGAQVRVINREDGPWFVATDVCRVLEIANSRHAASRLDDDERAAVVIDDTSLGGVTQRRSVTAVNESGLYSLIITSRVPSAKAFKKWVTSEVLPSIRKHGAYVAGQEKVATGEMSREELLARAMKAADTVLAERSSAPSPLSIRSSIRTSRKLPDWLASASLPWLPQSDRSLRGSGVITADYRRLSP